MCIGRRLAKLGPMSVFVWDLLPVPPHNPPGLDEALWPMPGTVIALFALYRYGVWKEEAPRGA